MKYREFEITYNPPPISDRRFDYEFSHGDYDGPGDSRSGTAASYDQAKEFIDEIIRELGYLDSCPECHQERVDPDHKFCDACRHLRLGDHRFERPK
tara:strand:- start:787 stop:1074 length:288 start_codon:yes stop_codon:yes gene_type:complete